MRLWVKGKIRGLNLERLLNEARTQGVRPRMIRRQRSGEMTVICSPKDYEALQSLAREKGFDMTAGKAVGLFRWLRALKNRWGLGLGLLLGCLAAALSLRYVWAVEVINAGAYEADARTYLQEIGAVPGALRQSVDLTRLREQLEWRWPRVQWVRAEWAGVALRITLEEGVPPPEVKTEGRTGDVVAAEDGLLTNLTVYAGTAEKKAGDFVRAGQVLIRGEERGGNGEMIPVKARGEAAARVWVSARVRLPLYEENALPTGRQTRRTVIETPLFALAFRETPDYLTWDREARRLPLGGAWLPMEAVRETYYEAALETGQRSIEDVKKEGQRAALALLNKALLGDETVDKWINFSMIDGDTILTEATAEVKRDIGRFQPR